jgi:hypothetical protein
LEKDLSLSLKDVEFNKRRLITYFGNIAEMVTEEILIKEGYLLCELRPYSTGESPATLSMGIGLWNCLSNIRKGKPKEDELKGHYRACYVPPPKIPNFSVPTWEEYYSNNLKMYEESIKEVSDFFGSKLEAFIKYVDFLGLITKDGALELSGKRTYTPDLIAKKNGEIYIIEVKANSGDLNHKPKRVKALLSAREFGLIPLIVHVNVSINATDFSMQELREYSNKPKLLSKGKNLKTKH